LKFLLKICKSDNMMSFLEKGLVAALGFSSFVLLSRSLSSDIFGVWVLYITMATFVEMLRSGILHSALVRFASGLNIIENEKIIASAWVIGLTVTALLATILIVVGQLIGGVQRIGDLNIFFTWYPILSFATLPHNFAFWILQAGQEFKKSLALRIIVSGLFTLFLCVNFMFHFQFETIVMAHAIINGIGSALAIAFGWSRISTMPKAERACVTKLLHFGKFSMGTLIGTNLLKSSDTFLIGWLLGPSAVAFYSVPLKLTELVEIPLRGFVSTSLPKMSRLALQKNNAGVMKIFKKDVVALTLAFIPVLVGCFLFAEELVVLLGGEVYRDAAIILRIFVVYMILLPLDRYIGIVLDSMNRPESNFRKIALMVIANVCGDFLALKFVGGVWAVAAVTISTFIVGTCYGSSVLCKLNDLRFSELLSFMRGKSTLNSEPLKS